MQLRTPCNVTRQKIYSLIHSFIQLSDVINSVIMNVWSVQYLLQHTVYQQSRCNDNKLQHRPLIQHVTLPANVPDLHFTISILTGKSQGCLHCDKLSSWLFQHKANVRLYLSNDFYLRFQLHVQQHIIRPTDFPRKMLPNSAGQLAKFGSSLWQNHPNTAARHGLPFMTEYWDSCSETSVIEGWHCTESYVSNIKKKIIFSFQKCNETHESWRESTEMSDWWVISHHAND